MNNESIARAIAYIMGLREVKIESLTKETIEYSFESDYQILREVQEIGVQKFNDWLEEIQNLLQDGRIE